MDIDQRELEFDKLRAIAKRITNAKHYLFTGKPYTSDMKPNKYQTYRKLCKMGDKNMQQVAELFS